VAVVILPIIGIILGQMRTLKVSDRLKPLENVTRRSHLGLRLPLPRGVMVRVDSGLESID